MNAVDLNEIVTEQLTDEGVTPITMGAVACAQLRGQMRALLKVADAEGYSLYRALKYPAGEGSDTPETCVAATRFLFDRARDLLAKHYVRSS